MRLKKTTIFIILFAGFITGCTPGVDKSNEQSASLIGKKRYIRKYAGGYTVEVSTVLPLTEGAEAYNLYKDGNARWMWIVVDGSGVSQTVSDKTGTWTANKDTISITVEGNTGLMNDEYVLKGGRFVSTLNVDRYLRPLP